MPEVYPAVTGTCSIETPEGEWTDLQVINLYTPWYIMTALFAQILDPAVYKQEIMGFYCHFNQ